MRVKKKLGQMLIEASLLTEEQLKQALLDQVRSSIKLGQFLIRKGLVSEQLMVKMLSEQLKIEKYHPDKYPLDLSLTQAIPLEYAQKYQIAPLKKKGRLLTICTTDPLDINALDAIEMLTDSEVEPSVCTEREMGQLISSLYGIQSGLGNMLETMELDVITAETKKKTSRQTSRWLLFRIWPGKRR